MATVVVLRSPGTETFWQWRSGLGKVITGSVGEHERLVSSVASIIKDAGGDNAWTRLGHRTLVCRTDRDVVECDNWPKWPLRPWRAIEAL